MLDKDTLAQLRVDLAAGTISYGELAAIDDAFAEIPRDRLVADDDPENATAEDKLDELDAWTDDDAEDDDASNMSPWWPTDDEADVYADWQAEVANGDTVLGFRAWIDAPDMWKSAPPAGHYPQD